MRFHPILLVIVALGVVLGLVELYLRARSTVPRWRRSRGGWRDDDDVHDESSSPMPEAEKAASAEGEAPKIEPEKAESEEAAVRPKAAPPEAVEPKESFVTPMEDPARGEELWNEARKMPHQFVPDKETDAKYLSLLVSSAELGFAEAQAKLGEYAVRRGCLVEAYYWMWRSNEKGWAASSYRAMRELRLVWLGAGAATEFDNVHEAFDKRRGAFARALLQFHCGLDRVNARKCIVELANELPEARRFLRIKTDPQI